MRYQLYVISCTGGFYPALNSSPPTESLQDIKALEEVIRRLRPGYGRHYVTAVVRCNPDDTLLSDDIESMRREADILTGFYR